MKNGMIFIIILLTLMSCQRHASDKRNRELMKKGNWFEIDLSSDLNFQEITDSVDNIESRAYTKIRDGIFYYKIPLNYLHSGGFKRERNGLIVTEDSILVIGKPNQPISNLRNSLVEHYSEIGNKSYVVIELDSTNSGKDLESAILTLRRNFRDMNKEMEEPYDLGIILNYQGSIREVRPTRR